MADALAYAHGRGVVHRDIKPDNVMLSGKHALVTHFGVAKAVSESTGRQSLTSLGVALGTPSYMAPEQAAAEPNVDHRADVYALGAMAYEMLAGRPPFTMSAQAGLAAHVTQTPEPVTGLRPAIPAALGGPIMRCLEKRPADLWQTADELVPHLEAVLTPSGGTAPTVATSALSSGTEAAVGLIDKKSWLLLLAFFIVGYAPFFLLSWNCYAYYISTSLLAYAIIVALAVARHRIFFAALAWAVVSSTISTYGNYFLEYPALIARANWGEEQLQEMVVLRKTHPELFSGQLYLMVENEHKFQGIGIAGIAYRLHLELDDIIVIEPGALLPDKKNILIVPDEGTNYFKNSW